MVQRVPVQAVIVQRDGKNFRPPLGKPFDFTAQEMDDIMRLSPDSVTKIITTEIDDNAQLAEAKRLQDEQDAEEERQRAAQAEADRNERLRQQERDREAEVQKARDEAAAAEAETAKRSAAAKAGAAKKNSGAASADSL